MTALARLVAALQRRQAHRRRPLDAMAADRFVTVDIETTGLDPRRDAIVSVAVIPFVAGEPHAGYATLVDPRRPIPAASTGIHGIRDEDVRGAPTIDAVLPCVDAVFGADIVVGHAVAFDLAVLARDARMHGRRAPSPAFLDTQRLAAACFASLPDAGLDAVAARVGVTIEGRHTARGDAVAAGRVLLALLPRLSAHGVRTVAEAQWLQARAAVPGDGGR